MKTYPYCAALAVTLLSTGCHGITPNALPTAPASVTLTASNILITSSPGELPIGGGTTTIRLEVRTIDGRTVKDVPVTLEVTGGTLEQTMLVSDSTGHALTTWQGTASATVRASSATATGEGAITVNLPIPIPPPSVPPPPAPRPPPDPPPPAPEPALGLTLSAYPTQVLVDWFTILTASAVTHLHSGETVVAYQWDFDGDGTANETSITPSRSVAYTASGIVVPSVTVQTSQGRSASASVRLVVFKPLTLVKGGK